MTLTRRSLIASAAALPVVLGARNAITHQSSSESKAKLGDNQEAFDSEYGAPVEKDGWVGYLTDRDDVAHYYVAFNDDGIAEAIEIDFKHLPGGGLSPAENEVGESRFIRDDAQPSPLVTGGVYRGDGGNYGFVTWHSPSLAEKTGRSGNVIVVDSYGIGSDGPTGDNVIFHTMLSMETFEVNELSTTGSELGPQDTLDTWKQEIPDHTTYQWGWMSLDNPPTPGQWMVAEGSVVILPEPPIPVDEARDLVSARIPTGTVLWTSYLRPGPLGGEGVRVHGVDSEGRLFVAAQWIAGEESNGEVLKIMLSGQPYPLEG